MDTGICIAMANSIGLGKKNKNVVRGLPEKTRSWNCGEHCLLRVNWEEQPIKVNKVAVPP